MHDYQNCSKIYVILVANYYVQCGDDEPQLEQKQAVSQTELEVVGPSELHRELQYMLGEVKKLNEISEQLTWSTFVHDMKRWVTYSVETSDHSEAE